MAQNKGGIPVESVPRAGRSLGRPLGRRLTGLSGRIGLRSLAGLRRAALSPPLPPGTTRANGRCFTGAQVAPSEATVLALPVNLIGVVRIDGTFESVAAAHRNPIFVDGPNAGPGITRTAPRAVVL